MDTARSLSLMACAALSMMGTAYATTTPRPDPGPKASERPNVVIGFSQDAKIRAPLQRQVEGFARYQVTVAGKGTTGNGLFISGRRMRSVLEHGWVNCRVRFAIVDTPGGSVRFTDTLAASVPLMPSRIFANRSERVEMAEEACLSELAQAMTEHLMSVASGPAPVAAER
jgi:hypothetical protein